MLYLTILPRMRVANIQYSIFNIQYSSTSVRTVLLLKVPTKHREFFPTLFVKTTVFQLVFNFEWTRTVTIFGEHGILAHIS